MKKSSLSWSLCALALIIILLLGHPDISSSFTTMFLGGARGDGGLYVWLVDSFVHDPLNALSFSAFPFYPYPGARAWSDNFLLPSSLIYALRISGVPLIPAYNSILLLALVLNGLCVAFLARSLALSLVTSFAVGAVFMNSSYLLANIGHPQLLFFFWAPLSWGLVSGPYPSPRRWLIAGLCASAAFYCGVYYAIFACIGLALRFAWRHVGTPCEVATAARSLISIGLGLTPVLPALPPYLSAKELFGPRGLHEAEAFAASGLSYLSFPAIHPLGGATSHWTHPEATLCPGYLTLGLACCSLLLIVWNLARAPKSKAIRPLAALAITGAISLGVASSIVDADTLSETATSVSAWLTLVAGFLAIVQYAVNSRGSAHTEGRAAFACILLIFLVISVGPGGNPAKGEPAFAPFVLLYQVVPGLEAVRAVSRAGIVVLVGIFLLAFGGISAATRHRPRAAVPCTLLFLVLAIGENYIPVIVKSPLETAPLALADLAHTTAPHEAIVILPFAGEVVEGSSPDWGEFAELNTRYMAWTAATERYLVNGYSGQRTKIQSELALALDTFPSERSAAALGRICGVSWIVAIPALMQPRAREHLEELLTHPSKRYRITKQYEDGSLLIRVGGEVPLPSPGEVIFMGPRTRRITLSASGSNSTGSAIRINRLDRDSGGTVTTSRIGEFSPDETTEFSLSPSDFPDRTRPAVFSVSSQGSGTVVQCSVAPLEGEEAKPR